MKKKAAVMIALLLAAAMALSACGGSASQTTEAPAPEKAETQTETASAEAPEKTEFALGEAFGTDRVECVVTEARWITGEDVSSHPLAAPEIGMDGGTYYTLKLSELFPGHKFLGLSGVSSAYPGFPVLCVTFTLRNTSDKTFGGEFTGDGIKPYGTMFVIFEDGYTAESEVGFISTLKASADPIVEGMAFSYFPDQQEEKDYQIKVVLPNSAGETEEFLVSVK